MGYPAKKLSNTQFKYKKERWKNKPSIHLVSNETKPRYFTYIVTADAGFAPNPFYRFCTLAVCKPVIRKKAKEGDWIIGLYSRAKKISSDSRGKLVYVMQVTEKMTLDEYWKNKKFFKKRYSDKNSKSRCGDNIYRKNSKGEWVQEKNQYHNSPKAQEADTKGKFVLISNNFFYFGKSDVQLPKDFKRLVSKIPRGHKYKGLEKEGEKLVNSLSGKYKIGVHGDPIDYRGNTDCGIKASRKVNIFRKGCGI